SLLVIGAICLMLGINPLELLGSIDSAPRLPDIPRTSPRSGSPFELPGAGQRVTAQDDEMSRFVRRVLADTEDVWDRVFQAAGKRYEKPTLVLFTRATPTACGVGQTAMGPFYCPLDHKVYIDLDFYRELKDRFHAPGDFAQAYVIAHEVGHHVQTLLGVANKVQMLKQQALQRGDEREVNRLQVRMELQADCLAGVWASLNDQVKHRLLPGDIENGLNAASQIGDDTLQRRAQGRVVPETFTHGSAEQRVRWFKRGIESGQTQSCDTFGTSQL
ncbi:MAG: zinc metallopeptidase, partial [Hyphomicrobiaceae bacterium]|nr:zinc metallopeptidase [Hyphomicrobiaceae bacterium]